MKKNRDLDLLFYSSYKSDEFNYIIDNFEDIIKRNDNKSKNDSSKNYNLDFNIFNKKSEKVDEFIAYAMKDSYRERILLGDYNEDVIEKLKLNNFKPKDYNPDDPNSNSIDYFAIISKFYKDNIDKLLSIKYKKKIINKRKDFYYFYKNFNLYKKNSNLLYNGKVYKTISDNFNKNNDMLSFNVNIKNQNTTSDDISKNQDIQYNTDTIDKSFECSTPNSIAKDVIFVITEYNDNSDMKSICDDDINDSFSKTKTEIDAFGEWGYWDDTFYEDIKYDFLDDFFSSNSVKDYDFNEIIIDISKSDDISNFIDYFVKDLDEDKIRSIGLNKDYASIAREVLKDFYKNNKNSKSEVIFDTNSNEEILDNTDNTADNFNINKVNKNNSNDNILNITDNGVKGFTENNISNRHMSNTNSNESGSNSTDIIINNPDENKNTNNVIAAAGNSFIEIYEDFFKKNSTLRTAHRYCDDSEYTQEDYYEDLNYLFGVMAVRREYEFRNNISNKDNNLKCIDSISSTELAVIIPKQNINNFSDNFNKNLNDNNVDKDDNSKK